MESFQIDDDLVNLEIWDMAGRERYHGMATIYYRRAQAALIVFDITDRVLTQKPSFSFNVLGII